MLAYNPAMLWLVCGLLGALAAGVILMEATPAKMPLQLADKLL